MEKAMNSTLVSNQLLRADQVATRLNISRALAYRLMQIGEIPTIRFHRTVRVSETDLDHFIQNHHFSQHDINYQLKFIE
jgi:excisionase family DNA binding protein